MNFAADYLDMLRCLNAAGADYLVVGGYAVMFHGYGRTTGDLDLWIYANPDNAKKVFAALKAFGAPLVNITEAELSSPNLIFQIGVEPCRIDIITKVDGLADYPAVKARAIDRDFGGVPVKLISYGDLIVNKSASGRLKDKADVEELTKRNPRHG